MAAPTVIAPGHNKSPACERCHRGLVLVPRLLVLVHPKLAPRCSTIGVVALPPYIVTRTPVMSTVISPGHNKTTPNKRGNRWIILTARGVGVHHKLTAHRNTTGIIALPPDVPTRTSIVRT